MNEIYYSACLLFFYSVIYLLNQEGENNDKFFTHPKDVKALAAYLFVHNHLFYLMELVTALLLLLLSLCEAPAVPMLRLGIYVCPSGTGWGAHISVDEGNLLSPRDIPRVVVGDGRWNISNAASG